jgi:tRNA G18 (ribose-2'-O)-methylase SpoU
MRLQATGSDTSMRGYFAIGVEKISKPMNVGNLVRSSHAFGASFFFTVGAQYRASEARSDTSNAPEHMPIYNWATLDDMVLPVGCSLVGVELTDDAIELPSFGHPLRAAYVLGPERGSLSPAMLARCRYVIKIPTAFCINVAMAGAIVMYDRVKTLGRYAARPVGEGPSLDVLPVHEQGAPKSRTKQRV